jgi:HAD superfamily hydrolase (TIGR01490 family)
MSLDIFDVDHTLTRRSTGTRFIMTAIRRGLVPRQVAYAIPWYALTYRLGVLRVGWGEEPFAFLAGLSRERLRDIARESFERWRRRDLYPRAVELVRGRLAAGRRVVLATSSFDVIVEPLAEHLGVREVIATTLEFRDGRCTGRIAGQPMLGGEKQRRMLEFIRDAGERPADCSFWSDSIYDAPLLSAVGEPVVVHPDLRLRRMARARGWPIIDLR